MTSIEPLFLNLAAGFPATIPSIPSTNMRRNARNSWTSALTRFWNTSLAFIPGADALQNTRRRSCAPWSFLSCSLIKPKHGQALPYGCGKSFPNPLPWLSLSAAPVRKSCRPSALITTSWTASGWIRRIRIPARLFSRQAETAKSQKNLLVQMGNWQNRKTPARLPPGTS